MVVAPASAAYQECTSTITSSFNGTAINQGDYIWFTGVFTVKGMGSSPSTVYVSHASITFTANNKTDTVNVPISAITFSSRPQNATTNNAPLKACFFGRG